MSVKFEETGRYSKDWYLQMVKEHGAKGSSSMARACSMNGRYKEFKSALAALVVAGRIEKYSVERRGKPKVCYKLTQYGKRYLKENDSHHPVVEIDKKPRWDDTPLGFSPNVVPPPEAPASEGKLSTGSFSMRERFALRVLLLVFRLTNPFEPKYETDKYIKDLEDMIGVKQ